MEKIEDGGLVLTAADAEGVLYLMLQHRSAVLDIHATTFPAINNLVAEWERVVAPLSPQWVDGSPAGI